MFLGNAMLEITLISLAMVIVSQTLQRRLVDRKAMKETQAQMKEKQRRLKELVGQEDKKSKAEAEQLQREMLALMGQNMRGTMRHMLVTLPMFLAIFWFLSATYAGTAIQLPVTVPVIHRNLSFEITSSISWLWWYIYSSLCISIVLSLGLKAAGK